MNALFAFQIRPISLEEGFEVECEGVINRPLRCRRLSEAIIAAAHVSHHLDAQVEIYDGSGALLETLPLKPELLLAD